MHKLLVAQVRINYFSVPPLTSPLLPLARRTEERGRGASQRELDEAEQEQLQWARQEGRRERHVQGQLFFHFVDGQGQGEAVPVRHTARPQRRQVPDLLAIRIVLRGCVVILS